MKMNRKDNNKKSPNWLQDIRLNKEREGKNKKSKLAALFWRSGGVVAASNLVIAKKELGY